MNRKVLLQKKTKASAYRRRDAVSGRFIQSKSVPEVSDVVKHATSFALKLNEEALRELEKY